MKPKYAQADMDEILNDLMEARNEIDRLKQVIKVKDFNDSLTLKELNTSYALDAINTARRDNARVVSENRMWRSMFGGVVDRIFENIKSLTDYATDDYGDILPFAEWSELVSYKTVLKPDAQALLDWLESKLTEIKD